MHCLEDRRGPRVAVGEHVVSLLYPIHQQKHSVGETTPGLTNNQGRHPRATQERPTKLCLGPENMNLTLGQMRSEDSWSRWEDPKITRRALAPHSSGMATFAIDNV